MKLLLLFVLIATVIAGISDIDGGGWILVRHVGPGNAWHAATDQLRGTDVYGTPCGPTCLAQWSIKFDKISFDQFLFATGDEKKWLIADKSSVIGWYANGLRPIVKSSINPNPYTARWYRRQGAREDPWISLNDHHPAIGQGNIVYGENRFGSTHANAVLPKSRNNGANVYIRLRGSDYVVLTGPGDFGGYTDIMDPSTCTQAAVSLKMVPSGARVAAVQNEGDRPFGCRMQTFGPPMWVNTRKNSRTPPSDVHKVIRMRADRSPPPTPAPTARPTTPPPTPTPTPSPTLSPTKSPTQEASYGNIIEWLKGLIAEGKSEIQNINDVLTEKKDKVTKASEMLRAATVKEGEAKSRMQDALQKLNEAKGAWDECVKSYNTEKARLDGEIAIFSKVKNTLNGLLNGKQLIEKEKDDVKAFISLADQADPAKVNQIMALVQNLIDAAEAELVTIGNDRDACKGRLESAQAAYAKAVGIWEAASNVVGERAKDLDTARGELNAYDKYASDRISVVQDEINTMEDIISLLKPLFE